jgi:hypothetical protein
MKPRTSAITETVLVVHWPDAPSPTTWQALKPSIEAWIEDVNPDYPKFAGPSYSPGSNHQALELLISRLDEHHIVWELQVTTTVKPAEPGVQPMAWGFQIPPHEIGNTYVDGGERFVVSMVNGERSEPRVEGDSPADSPEDALRRTIEFVGSSDGYQNHWYVYDRETGVLHQFEQDASGRTLVLAGDGLFSLQGSTTRSRRLGNEIRSAHKARSCPSEEAMMPATGAHDHGIQDNTVPTPVQRRYIVTVREVHTQMVQVDAVDPDDAKAVVRSGGGEYLDNTLEYSHTLDCDTWTVEQVDGSP